MGYWKGRVLVMACKFSYSFGCLVAYIVVIKDNCGPALRGLLFGKDNNDDNHKSNNDCYKQPNHDCDHNSNVHRIIIADDNRDLVANQFADLQSNNDSYVIANHHRDFDGDEHHHIHLDHNANDISNNNSVHNTVHYSND